MDGIDCCVFIYMRECLGGWEDFVFSAAAVVVVRVGGGGGGGGVGGRG